MNKELNKVKVAVSGANGRMGKSLVQLIKKKII